MRRLLGSLAIVVLGTVGGVALLVEDVWFPTADGLVIHGWFHAPAAPTPRTLRLVRGAGHTDMWSHWADEIGPAVRAFIEAVVPGV